MSQNPKISVCIPVYNVQELLPKSLDSVLSQDFEDIEVICVNDATPDDSGRILDEYAARDPRIRIITKTRNEGLMMARRTGYLNARGGYVFFMDSDDTIPAGTLKALYDEATATGADIVVGDYDISYPDGRTSRRSKTRSLTSAPESYYRAIMTGTSCTIWGVLFDRKLFDSPEELTTFMNQSFSEDRVLLVQLLVRAHKIAKVSRSVYNYNLNQGSMTVNRQSVEKLRTQFRALDWVYTFLTERNIMPELAAASYLKILSFYLESGYPLSTIKELTPTGGRLLEFGNMRRYIGLRLALHTWAAGHVPGYPRTAWAGRMAMRKILGR